jgi:hypothetical protein
MGPFQSDEREFVMQKYLSVVESGDFENFEDIEPAENNKDKEQT